MREFDVLEEREIQVIDPGATLCIAAQIAKLAERRLRKRGCVEPLGDCSLIDGGIADKIRPVRSERVVQSAKISGGNSERESMLPGVDSVQLPPAYQRLLRAGRIARNLPAFPEGQVVNEAADESMIDVEVRQS